MHALLIHNPVSGHPARHAALNQMLATFAAGGWQIALRQTEHRGHARDLAALAVRQGYEHILIAGGDGSIAQTVDGIIQAGGEGVALGILPIGTGNVFARAAGLPLPDGRHTTAPAAIARLIMQDRPRVLDVGLANGVAFLSWAGLGFDAAVAGAIEQNLTFKRRAPTRAYLGEGIKQLLRLRPLRLHVSLDGGRERFEGCFPLAVANNIPLYARWFRLAPAARPDDGQLDFAAIICAEPPRFLYTALKLLIYPRTRDRCLLRRPCRSLHISAETPQPCHVDGDPLGFSPLDVTLLPQRLPVYLPHD